MIRYPLAAIVALAWTAAIPAYGQFMSSIGPVPALVPEPHWISDGRFFLRLEGATYPIRIQLMSDGLSLYELEVSGTTQRFKHLDTAKAEGERIAAELKEFEP